jgi:hypothetical protein
MTPAQLAADLWGTGEGFSTSPGALKVRRAARILFPDAAPGQGGEWELTEAQAGQIREHLSFTSRFAALS